eukprot:CAMPEP_0196593312 /NCGR_PEP_ID=MMETSP1081-20130531/75315_1 /TAXON_ID=36882 /ORGANISM="Pyramimonas amylifera, Strain CCMP720" /LENGTH=124 /DNA_ID=CAMNT_0041917263 /DNA_START=33 /DNA_END=403 /DNA_ORIENTATION=-
MSVPPPPAGSPTEDKEEDFSDIYGRAYEAPRLKSRSPDAKHKRAESPHDSDSDDAYALQKDMNGLPLEFTTTEDKAFRKKQRAIEKQWKKSQELSDVCGVCGQKGHFTQGCPSTLGIGRGSGGG